MNLRPKDQSFQLVFSFHFPNFCCNNPLARSTRPCDCGCRGRPFIIFTDGHISINSLITSAQNSFPLSDCNIVGEEPI